MPPVKLHTHTCHVKVLRCKQVELHSARLARDLLAVAAIAAASTPATPAPPATPPASSSGHLAGCRAPKAGQRLLSVATGCHQAGRCKGRRWEVGGGWGWHPSATVSADTRCCGPDGCRQTRNRNCCHVNACSTPVCCVWAKSRVLIWAEAVPFCAAAVTHKRSKIANICHTRTQSDATAPWRWHTTHFW